MVEAVTAAVDLNLVGEFGRGEDLSTLLRSSGADVVVDFTDPEAIVETLPIYLEVGVHPVVGTTGIPQPLLQQCIERSRQEQLGGVVAANFSIGAILMMQLAERAAPHMPQVEILEYHHTAKKDSPSGTALHTRDRIAGAGAPEIPIHSMRLDGFLASQEVIFAATGERLSIRHDSIDRRCYMPGVLLAIRRCVDLKEIVVGIDSLL